MIPHPSPLASHRHLRDISLVLSAVLIALVAIVVAAPHTQAQDATVRVITHGHTHAPFVSWTDDDDNNTFSAHIGVEAGEVYAPENTVLWIRRGALEEQSGTPAQSRYIVPANANADLGFLGGAGTPWFIANQNNNTDWSAPYVGLNDDKNAPTYLFSGNTYAVDLVDVRGPGRMEAFETNAGGVKRRFSSSNLAYRSFFEPRHSHYHTVFSKPGLYQVDYVASARREADGTQYLSPTATIQWQVGGTNPAERTYRDVNAAFQRARSAQLPEASFTISPHNSDPLLSTMSFSSGDANINGRVVFQIDGYFLAEIPTTKGVAHFTEMLGAGTSFYQAAFFPDADTTSAWASDIVEYTTGQASASTSRAVNAIVPARNHIDNIALAESPSSPASRTVSLDFVPEAGHPDRYCILVQAGDPHLSGYVKVRTGRDYHEQRQDFKNLGTVKFVEGNLEEQGRFETVEDFSVYRNNDTLAVTIVPHSRHNLAAGSFVFRGFSLEKTRHFLLDLSTGAIAPRDGVTPEVPKDGPGEGEAPKPDDSVPQSPSNERDTTKVTLDRGHLDLRLVATPTQGLTFGLNDDTLQVVKDRTVLRDPRSVTLKVTSRSLKTDIGRNITSTWDLLGDANTRRYVLDQSGAYQDKEIWPGFSTEGIDYQKHHVPADMRLRLRALTLPQGGRVGLSVAHGLQGTLDILFDSAREGEQTIPAPPGTHMHVSWIFTTPGTYVLSLDAVSADGKTQVAPAVPVTFVVEGEEQHPQAPTPQTPDNPSPESKKPQTPEVPTPQPQAPERPAPEAHAPKAPKPQVPTPQPQVPDPTVPQIPRIPAAPHSHTPSNTAPAGGTSHLSAPSQPQPQQASSTTPGGGVSSNGAPASANSRPNPSMPQDQTTPHSQSTPQGSTRTDDADGTALPEAKDATVIPEAGEHTPNTQNPDTTGSTTQNAPARGGTAQWIPLAVAISVAGALGGGVLFLLLRRKERPRP
ncbi:choice-of-anchor M domain-containing protein [Schaalia suimastitidis]|uniref:choice-of-anchor M domain-containing protein n=1 Tax=Schaalia suimastitidis TaxID=121163 RepID=UPI00040849B7|nr:choice-of-anchor M domain-containing protein [Schaalia suimastitidis]